MMLFKLAAFFVSCFFISCVAVVPPDTTLHEAILNGMFDPYPTNRALSAGDVVHVNGMFCYIVNPQSPTKDSQSKSKYMEILQSDIARVIADMWSNVTVSVFELPRGELHGYSVVWLYLDENLAWTGDWKLMKSKHAHNINIEIVNERAKREALSMGHESGSSKMARRRRSITNALDGVLAKRRLVLEGL